MKNSNRHRIHRIFEVFALTLLVVVNINCSTAKKLDSVEATSKPEVAPVKDQRAIDELKNIGKALSAANSIQFRAVTMSPVRGPNEQWVHVFSTSDVKLQRPNQLFIATGGDAFPQKFYFDGTYLAVHSAETKLYTQTNMPGSIDTMLALTSKHGGTSFAFSDVLLEDPFASWNHELLGAIFVGESVREGEKLKHIALTAKGVDWEMWVNAKTHLPRTVYVKYTTGHRAPSVMIEFSKWRLNSKINESNFIFKAPKGTNKANLKAPEGAKL